jgi:protein ImuA
MWNHRAMERAIGDGSGLAELRRAVAAIEGRPTVWSDPGTGERGTRAAMRTTTERHDAVPGGIAAAAPALAPLVDFGLPGLDRRLGPLGGLAPGSLHEIVCDESRGAGALVGFLAALLARLAERRPGRILWIATGSARRETGGLHPPGLAAFGLDPNRLVEAVVGTPEDALWAAEEALTCRGTAAVVIEIPGNPRVLDLTATRRLALRAAAAGSLGLLARVAGAGGTTAAVTRWRVGGRASRPFADFPEGLGRPAFRLTLEKNRDGRLGDFEIEWDPHDRRFALLPAHSGAAAPSPADRPAAADGARILPFDRPGTGRRIG